MIDVPDPAATARNRPADEQLAIARVVARRLRASRRGRPTGARPPHPLKGGRLASLRGTRARRSGQENRTDEARPPTASGEPVTVQPSKQRAYHTPLTHVTLSRSTTRLSVRPVGHLLRRGCRRGQRRRVARTRELIASRHYVLDSEWGDMQPAADVQNSSLDRHGWADYSAWPLGLTVDPAADTQGQVRVRRGRLPPNPPKRADRMRLSGITVAHKAVEVAAHDLLQELDASSGVTGT